MVASTNLEREHERGPRVRVERDDDNIDIWLDVYRQPGVVAHRWHMLTIPNTSDGRAQESLVTPLIEAAAWLIWYRGVGDELLDVGRALEPLIARADEVYRGDTDGYEYAAATLPMQAMHTLVSEEEQLYLQIVPDEASMILTLEELDDVMDQAVFDDIS